MKAGPAKIVRQEIQYEVSVILSPTEVDRLRDYLDKPVSLSEPTPERDLIALIVSAVRDA